MENNLCNYKKKIYIREVLRDYDDLILMRSISFGVNYKVNESLIWLLFGKKKHFSLEEKKKFLKNT